MKCSLFSKRVILAGVILLICSLVFSEKNISFSAERNTNYKYHNENIMFNENKGVYDKDVLYYSVGFGGSLQMHSDGFDLILPPRRENDKDDFSNFVKADTFKVKSRFLNIGESVEVNALDPLDHTITIATGDNKDSWQSSMSYGAILYRNLYSGVDLRYDGEIAAFKGTYSIKSGVDPKIIQWKYEGVDDVEVDKETGDLILTLLYPNGYSTKLVEHAPVVWQEIDKIRYPLKASFSLDDSQVVSFKIESYNYLYPITIDPSIDITSLTLGQNSKIAVDENGWAYVLSQIYDGHYDVSLTAISPAGVSASTFVLHGSNDEFANDIVINSKGLIYIVGTTTSSDIPTPYGLSSFHTNSCGIWGMCSDAFIAGFAKDNNILSQRFGDFLGGMLNDEGYSIALDSAEDIYVVGRRDTSASFSHIQWYDQGNLLLYISESTINGYGSAVAKSIAVDANNMVYIGGSSLDPNYDDKAWVARLDSSGELISQAVLGGDIAQVNDITIDLQGHIYVTGTNYDESAFPPLAALSEGYQGVWGEVWKIGFAAELNSDLSLVYETRIAGDRGNGIIIDGNNKVYIATERYSENAGRPIGLIITINPNGEGWGDEIIIDESWYDTSSIAKDSYGVMYLSGDSGIATISGVLSVSPPTESAAAYYVNPNWATYVDFNGESRMLAYRYGFKAGFGKPRSNILLMFGRQKQDDTGRWGVALVGSSLDFYSNEWVKAVADAYIEGYTAAYDDWTFISLGVSNANNDWLCDYTTEVVDERWYDGGEAWGELISSIDSTSDVTIQSANDIEDWHGQFGTWLGCGAGAVKWIDGYSSSTRARNVYVGDNPIAQSSEAWTSEQLYHVTYGNSVAYLSPQIYCRAIPSQWVNFQTEYPNLKFLGVVSDGGHFWPTGICGGAGDHLTYTWDQSWTALNTALEKAGFIGHLYPMVSEFIR